MEDFLHGIPKAELHVHIEGTLEAELLLELAAKNGIDLPFESIDEIRRAYNFTDLKSFLDIYYQGTEVLLDEDDFYRLTRAYLEKAAGQNVRHTEIFFDPQSHTARGVKFETAVNGIARAMMDARSHLDLSSKLIVCFLRDRGLEEALETLEQALPFKDQIAAVGLDSAELGFPPEIFVPVFERARRKGFKAVAHAGEEGPPEYIRQAVDLLGVERIDHGVRCTEDSALVEYLLKKQIPLTVCPLSNVKLRVFEHMRRHNLKEMLDLGLRVTVNSDDPAYFGGYIEENFRAMQAALGLTRRDIYKLARNAFEAAFINPLEKKEFLDELDEFVSRFSTLF